VESLGLPGKATKQRFAACPMRECEADTHQADVECKFRADHDQMESSERVKMLEK
jgi:hypothetical protein